MASTALCVYWYCAPDHLLWEGQQTGRVFWSRVCGFSDRLHLISAFQTLLHHFLLSCKLDKEAFRINPRQGQHFFFLILTSPLWALFDFICLQCAGIVVILLHLFSCLSVACALQRSSQYYPAAYLQLVTDMAGMPHFLRMVLYLALSSGTDQFVPTSKALSLKLFTF